MEPIKTALIGFGKAGEWLHAPFIDLLPEFQLSYIMERSKERSKELYPYITCVKDIDVILKDPLVELIVIATPNNTHAELAEQALKHGKHVIIDKPFTVRKKEALYVQALSKETGKQVFVYQNRRWDSDFLTVQKLLRSGIFGDVFYIESRFDRYRPEPRTTYWKESDEPGNGLWYDLGPHLMDQAFSLFGKPDSTTTDIKIQRAGAVGIDYFDVLFQYPTLEYRIHAGMLEKEPTPRWLLKGSKGTYIKYGTDPQEAILSVGGKPEGADWGKEKNEAYGTINYTNGTSVSYPTEQGDYRNFYRSVYDAIRLNNDFPITLDSAVELVEWLESICQRNSE
jgi:scyllo-inositol 2-dehydrogenase (NADP+)